MSQPTWDSFARVTNKENMAVSARQPPTGGRSPNNLGAVRLEDYANHFENTERAVTAAGIAFHFGPIQTTGKDQSAGRWVTDDSGSHADDATGGVDPRSLLPWLSFEQDRVALVQQRRAGVMVGHWSRKWRAADDEPVRVGPLWPAETGEETATDLRRSYGWRDAAERVYTVASRLEAYSRWCQDTLRLD